MQTTCVREISWIADVPELPGVSVYGPTHDEAIAAAKAVAFHALD